MYRPDYSGAHPTYNSVRKKRTVPIYDQHGKVVSERVEEYLERVKVTDCPNVGLHYEDFDVENAQRLGIPLNSVPTGGQPVSFSERQKMTDYFNSDQLINDLNSQDNATQN